MSNPLVFFQIVTPMPEELQSFLTEVFDWKITGGGDPSSGCSIDPQGPADLDVKGAVRPADEDQAGTATSSVIPYFRVQDLWQTVERAERLGAEIVTPIYQTPGGAHTATFRTVGGLLVGLFQA